MSKRKQHAPEFKATIAFEASKGEEPVANLASRVLLPPFQDVHQMSWHLRNEGHLVKEKRIRRLMRVTGLTPICQKPNTSKAAKCHRTYPSLPRGPGVDRLNQVWCADIIWLPMRRGLPVSVGHN